MRRNSRSLFKKRPKIKTRIRKPSRIIRSSSSINNEGNDKISRMKREQSYRGKKRNKSRRR